MVSRKDCSGPEAEDLRGSRDIGKGRRDLEWAWDGGSQAFGARGITVCEDVALQNVPIYYKDNQSRVFSSCQPVPVGRRKPPLLSQIPLSSHTGVT